MVFLCHAEFISPRLTRFQHLINQIPNQVQDDEYDILFLR